MAPACGSFSLAAFRTGPEGRLVTVNVAISNSISRLTAYYRRHGFGATIRRAGLSFKRGLFSSRMVVFYCDLAKQTMAPVNIPSSLKVGRLRSYSELSAQDLQEMTSFWNPKQAHRNIRERFDQGASLWLINSGDKLAGFSWTLRGRTIAPYYFLLGADDVQLFDFYVFPKFRGRAILWFLVAHILSTMKAEGAARVFGDVAEWNQPSLSFYRMTPFRRLGLVRSFTILGHRFVSWVENEPAVEIHKSTEPMDTASSMARSHKQ
ncbi:MAG: GNAT family N-acetyltransferase [Candidatus Acidiferrales bacterium]